MDVRITPEPTEEERKAILAALAEDAAAEDALSPWADAALPDDQATARLRNNRGAERA